MATGIAYVFPGQGSQAVGMGLDICEKFPSAREVFEEADAALGFSLSGLCFEGPDEELRRTVNAQPAIMTTSVACLRAASVKRPYLLSWPTFVAGHSLGEYTALVAAEVLDFPTALGLVRERGRLMEQAGQHTPGGMAAIIGLEQPIVEEICQEAGVEVANFNSPGQIGISGTKEALAKAMELAQARGARRVVPLEVSAAFHSRLMAPAREGMARAVAALTFHDAKVPIIANSTGEPIAVGEAIQEELLRQVCSPVLWQRSVEYMAANGVTTFIEIGPGKVLTGLIRRISEDARLMNLGDLASILGEESSAS